MVVTLNRFSNCKRHVNSSTRRRRRHAHGLWYFARHFHTTRGEKYAIAFQRSQRSTTHGMDLAEDMVSKRSGVGVTFAIANAIPQTGIELFTTTNGISSQAFPLNSGNEERLEKISTTICTQNLPGKWEKIALLISTTSN